VAYHFEYRTITISAIGARNTVTLAQGHTYHHVEKEVGSFLFGVSRMLLI
jgi:hypothetical protein